MTSDQGAAAPSHEWREVCEACGIGFDSELEYDIHQESHDEDSPAPDEEQETVGEDEHALNRAVVKAREAVFKHARYVDKPGFALTVLMDDFEAAIASEARCEAATEQRAMWEVAGQDADYQIARIDTLTAEVERLRTALGPIASSMRAEADDLDAQDNYAKQILRGYAGQIERIMRASSSEEGKKE